MRHRSPGVRATGGGGIGLLVVTLLALALASCSGGTAESDAPTTSAAARTLPIGASTGCADPAGGASELDGRQTLEIGGEERTYLLSAPDPGARPAPAPLVLDLPGFGATSEAQDASTRLSELGPERGYIVATPEAMPATVGSMTGPMWNIVGAFSTATEDAEADVDLSESDDVAYLDALADHIESTLCVDTAREYITGMSVGAGMTTWAICQEGARFAAAAPVAGLTQGLSCPAATVPPFITFHGDADTQVDYAGGNLSGFDLGIPAVEERAADFAARQGCASTTAEDPIGEDVVHITWDCPGGAGAEVYRILGGGHVWPGSPDPNATQTVDATALILDFFDAHGGAR